MLSATAYRIEWGVLLVVVVGGCPCIFVDVLFIVDGCPFWSGVLVVFCRGCACCLLEFTAWMQVIDNFKKSTGCPCCFLLFAGCPCCLLVVLYAEQHVFDRAVK